MKETQQPLLIDKKRLEYNLIHLNQIVFEVTDLCNLQCKYCAYSDLYEKCGVRETGNLPFEKAKLILDYLISLWTSKLNRNYSEHITVSFYGGEPLLNMPLIEQIMGYIKENNHKIGKETTYSMTTNAMLLDRYMDVLVENDFCILISLDGDEKGQSYRVDKNGVNSFHRVVKNIKLLKDTYPEYFKRNVSFNSVLHNRNSVESTHNFIKETFGKTPSIVSLTSSGIREESREAFKEMYNTVTQSLNCSSQREKLEEEMSVKSPDISIAANYIIKKSGNVFDTYNQIFVEPSQFKYMYTGTCVPFSKKMFVTTAGKILQCERIAQEFSLGHITDKVELDLERIACFYNTITRKFEAQCKQCLHFKKCGHCVYNIDVTEDSKCSNFEAYREEDAEKDICYSILAKNPSLYKRIIDDVIIR